MTQYFHVAVVGYQQGDVEPSWHSKIFRISAQDENAAHKMLADWFDLELALDGRMDGFSRPTYRPGESLVVIGVATLTDEQVAEHPERVLDFVAM